LRSFSINYVIEATGKYKTFEDLNAHNRRSQVILSAPSEVDNIKTVVIGVNDIFYGTETIFLMRAAPRIMQHP
jgi:glyceraldehyde 3-phosphate dehydrogenase